MRIGSLFSGIGGLEYGLERSGLSTSTEWMIEMDEYCCSVLEKNFPNTLIINKRVEEINPLDLPKVDIITAGFPCQPVSVAGTRKGVMDERWLWDEVWRFIDVLRPRYFILENVPGIFTANKGKAFERVIKDIAKVADIDVQDKGYSRITITSEKAILIIDKLDSDYRLITWCEQSCNLGMIRKNLDNAVQRLNSYLGN